MADRGRKRVLCRYFLKNSCTYDKGCKFSHDLPTGEPQVCRYYRQGNCDRGDSCWYSHVIAETPQHSTSTLASRPIGAASPSVAFSAATLPEPSQKHPPQRTAATVTPEHDQGHATTKLCGYCGTKHPPRECPAFGKVCSNCGKRDHFRTVCWRIDRVPNNAETSEAVTGRNRLVYSQLPAAATVTPENDQGHAISWHRRSDTLTTTKLCGYCGTEHPPRECPAFGKVCNNCGKINHYSSVCRRIDRVPNNAETSEDNRGFLSSGSSLGSASPGAIVTTESIARLHRQLESCPKPTVEAKEPEGLSVPLLIHQRQALAWLAWRERQLPPGGILADDMGLGKTLTMIAHILSGKQTRLSTPGDEEDSAVLNSDKQMRPTLVVCPASLIHQWETEIKRRCNPDALTVQLFHGAKREQESSRLAAADIVLTTYSIVGTAYAKKTKAVPKSSDSSSSPKHSGDAEQHGDQSKRSPLFLIHWERVVLDEAHNIKNHNSQSALAVCSLTARARWAVTGTPVQNNYTDFYSLLRFIQCKPFDDAKVWKKWVDNESRDGIERLGILSRSLLLRRTKQDMDSTGKPPVVLPKKTYKCHKIELLAEERKLYDIIHSRAESALLYMQNASKPESVAESRPGARRSADNVEGDRMPLRQQQPLPPPTRGSLLLLLLRLRQCCCHVALTKEPLPDEEAQEESICADDLSLAMARLQLDGSAVGNVSSPTSGSTCVSTSPSSGSGVSSAGERSQGGLAGNGAIKDAAAYDLFSPSSKVAFLMAQLEEIKGTSKGTVSKSVVVSQWTSMLDIVAQQLEAAGYRYYTIRGNVEPKRRSEIVEDFNGNPTSPEVMLVSLRAGGVGLNLVGANHLFLMDPHWNPALEDQACDRIYRLGQVKEVYIHKLLSKDTIEEKITDLQCRKRAMADSALGSNKEAAKSGLSLDDLKMLFRVG